MKTHGIDFASDAIRSFCVKWKIKELSVFGSILRDDFRPDSDVDFLVEFEDGANRDPRDHFAMEEELAAIVERKVDLTSKDRLKWVVRDRVLADARVIHEA